MKRYLVKEISKATDENKNRRGEVQISYLGKDCKLLKLECPLDKRYDADRIPWMLEKYGYKRLSDARRSWAYNNPENTKFWSSRAEIVEIELGKGLAYNETEVTI